MRAISLVKRIEFDFSGNVVRNALTLGDVDNDDHNELIVGNQSGDISVFKVCHVGKNKGYFLEYRKLRIWLKKFHHTLIKGR